MTEIKVVLIDGGIITAARQQHISYTASHGAPELHLDVELVQVFQQAALGVKCQIPEIVRDVVLYQHLSRLFQKLGKRLHLFSGNPKAVGQGFHHGKLMPELHLPDGYGSPGIAVCVGKVEHIAQTVLGRGGIEQSNAVGAFVDPAPKPIPDVDAGAGGGVGLLLMNQKLLNEIVLVIVGGGAKKSKVLRLRGKHLCFQPFRCVSGDFVLAWHIIPPI